MPPSRKQQLKMTRITALCYIRQSFTRDANDRDSPERQRANIQVVCDRNSWIPEWFEDAEGHKSGRDEKNRPGWLALRQRLGDPDVVALVANDLARLHRKTWRVGHLLDLLDEHGVHLVLAAPGREIDTSTPMGRMMVNFMAMQDEAYATDIAQRAKDSIAYRKGQGKTVGMPPFGTFRNAYGYLEPSPHGAWLLPDGRLFGFRMSETVGDAKIKETSIVQKDDRGVGKWRRKAQRKPRFGTSNARPDASIIPKRKYAL